MTGACYVVFCSCDLNTAIFASRYQTAVEWFVTAARNSGFEKTWPNHKVFWVAMGNPNPSIFRNMEEVHNAGLESELRRESHAGDLVA